MFKKYKGFNSRFKLPSDETNNSEKNKLKIDPETPEREKTESGKSLVWPEIQTENNSGTKTDFNSFLKSKKKFVFPDLSNASIDAYSFSKKLFNFIKSKFRMHKGAFAGILIGFMTAIILTFIFIIITDYRKVKGLADYQSEITTNIYDKNGLLISELFKQKRKTCLLQKFQKI